MVAHGARRLLPMAENAAGILAIELLAAAQGCDSRAPLCSSVPLEAVRALVRTRVPTLQEDRLMHPGIAAAIALVESGQAAEAAGLALPGIAPNGLGAAA